MTTASLNSLTSRLGELGPTVISSHISPDPDAVGSAVGLAFLLKSLGIETSVYLADPVPERMQRLLARFAVSHELPDKHIKNLIVVDTASERRLGPQAAELLKGRFVINIDHHFSNSAWGDLSYIQPQASATALIIWQIARSMQLNITPEVANLLYAGLIDDTGGFSYSNTSAEAFICAADLVGCGADPAFVGTELYYSVPERSIRLHALASADLKTTAGGAIAYIVVSRAMLEQAGARLEDVESLVDLCRKMKGVLAAVLFVELADAWKISLRSKVESLNVNVVAEQFGGGGHQAAAGCRLSGDIALVKQQIIAQLEKMLGV